ncbi:MAG: DNA/RNA non-specific endonuclease [Peptostreptococcus sp.]|uniref:DNA/RNA non-specific endonuclease n=1 Tax=Peptostreptococcus sp. TaxID=1262 RepID=UPI002FCABB4F
MSKKKKKSPKYSLATIIIALVIIVGSRVTGIDLTKLIDSNTNENETKYESKIDKNDNQGNSSNDQSKNTNKSKHVNESLESDKAYAKEFDYNRDVPTYTNKPSVTVNNGRPYFAKPTSTEVYKNYSDLDKMNRVGPCEVLTGPEYLPKEKRGDISNVKPTGWKQKKYDFVDGKHLYNRCHLIGFQIAGDNDDWRNLMTGTRYMNVDGMLPYENEIAQYIKSSKNHVKYRVSPIFIGDEQVARGVLMEAYSVEDNKIEINAFCYNVQPGVTIDYNTGSSKLSK